MANIDINVQQLPQAAQLMCGSDGTRYYDNYDRSVLCDIKPDFNCLNSMFKIVSDFYTEASFNEKFSQTQRFSLRPYTFKYSQYPISFYRVFMLSKCFRDIIQNNCT